ncbi:MAG: hypothetical protein NZ555_16605, partial [Geminicoccaceae bacterium]|nr:hypothetical protein [Geminicoccaceae bacterium]
MTVIRWGTARAVVLASLFLLHASPMALAQGSALEPERLQQELRRAIAERDRLAVATSEQERRIGEMRAGFDAVRAELEERLVAARTAEAALREQLAAREQKIAALESDLRRVAAERDRTAALARER